MGAPKSGAPKHHCEQRWQRCPRGGAFDESVGGIHGGAARVVAQTLSEVYF